MALQTVSRSTSHCAVCLDEDRCDGCGLCLPACSFKALQRSPDDHIPFVDVWACMCCGACATACPQGALRL